MTLQDKSRAGGRTIHPTADPDCCRCSGAGWYMVGFGGDFEDCLCTLGPVIPRTRAKIVRYAKQMAFTGGGSVWSSSNQAGYPVYEETTPYDKVPAAIRAKQFLDITREEALLYARAADRADTSLDKMIYYKFFVDVRNEADLKAGRPLSMSMAGRRPYTFSLDAAVSLFIEKPETIPTDILDVVVMALEQRIEMEEDDER